MKFCPHCGQQIPDAARFCRACGTRITPSQPAVTRAEDRASPREERVARGTAEGPVESSQGTMRAEKPVPSPPSPSLIQVVSARSQVSSAREPPPVPSNLIMVERPGPRRPPAITMPPPAPVTAPEEEEEFLPPPPKEGMRFTWQREANGNVHPAPEPPPAGDVSSDPSSPAADIPAQPTSPPPETATQPVALPPAPTPWKFREQTSAWADKLAAQVRGASATKHQPVLVAAARMIQGALLHRDIYRHTAQRPDINTEAFGVAGAIIIAGFLGVLLTGAGFNLGLLWRTALMRIVGWGCAVFAIQVAAKTLQQIKVDLPPAVWFRGLIYAQAPLLLVALPGIGGLCILWAALCTVAALHDLTGRNTMAAVILAVIGGIASVLGVRIATAILF